MWVADVSIVLFGLCNLGRDVVGVVGTEAAFTGISWIGRNEIVSSSSSSIFTRLVEVSLKKGRHNPLQQQSFGLQSNQQRQRLLLAQKQVGTAEKAEVVEEVIGEVVGEVIGEEDNYGVLQQKGHCKVRRTVLWNGWNGLWVLSTFPNVARSDVSDGTSLPQGAQQFARVIKLKSDLMVVRTRIVTAAAAMEEKKDDTSKSNDETNPILPMDGKEWENVGKFLRTVYSVAENDMKFIAKGIGSTENRTVALTSIDLLKKYAQAGDVSVTKKDSANLAIVLEKCSTLVQDFLDALSDVPDEL